jgi:DNA mismatch repair protein MutL
MVIQKLPDKVIKLIAAGEVIDSLTSVVRELVENSLDAGATRIVVSVWRESWQIQVADNGKGMSEEDLLLCVQPYTTSKIYSREDLGKIGSLGFRGEALHSIAQLADLNISSRSSDDLGWEIIYKQGKMSQKKPVAIASGTIVVVSNLFGNIPIRRQGNPPFKQQVKQIQILMGELALCHPHVMWQLFVNDRLSLKISAGKSGRDIFPQLLKQLTRSDLQLVKVFINTPGLENHNSSIELVLGLPDRVSRNRPDWIKIGINHRVVKISGLESIILASLHRTLPRDRFPIAFLHLKTSPAEIDWNRHPTKAAIYLHNLSFWQAKMQAMLTEALKITPAQLPSSLENQRVEKLLNMAETKGVYHLDNQSKNIQEKQIGLIELKAKTQIRNTYIVAEHPEGLWLIEQHIAHERVLYEQLQDTWKIINLETPIILSKLNEKQLEQLGNIGLEIEEFGDNLWAVRTIPQVLLNREDCADSLLELSRGINLDSAQVAIACRTAIRNGRKLTFKQMQTLIDKWKITRNPHTCPHGRPIYLALDESSLYRFFRRHWVLGKSHGI